VQDLILSIHLELLSIVTFSRYFNLFGNYFFFSPKVVYFVISLQILYSQLCSYLCKDLFSCEIKDGLSKNMSGVNRNNTGLTKQYLYIQKLQLWAVS
jgi:hypothetical protein